MESREASPIFCLFAGGIGASTAMWSCSSSASKASEERVERGEPPGEDRESIMMMFVHSLCRCGLL